MRTSTLMILACCLISTANHAQLQQGCIRIDGGFVNMDYSDAAQVADGGFVSAGFHQFSNNGHVDACIARFDANGALLWQKVWTAGAAYNSQGQAVLATADGGFAVAGYVEGNVARGLFVMKFDGQDNVQWTKSYMPAANNSVAMGADGFTQLADGGFALQAL